MRNNALYFPYIDVPNDAWTVKALLYWDKLSSIVPMGHMETPDDMSDFMRELMTEGLVEPVFPGQFIHQIERFDESFIALIEHRLAKQENSRRAREIHGRTKVHAEKLGQIPDFLVDAGLASRGSYPWYEIDTPVANLFMAYLASCLGAVPDVNATPVTDKTLFASTFNGVRSRAASGVHVHKAREVVLRSLLPVPVGPIAADKLIVFKRRHGHLLPALRDRIEAHCAFVALLPDAGQRVQANDAFVQGCKDQVAEIEEAMRPNWKKITYDSLTPLIGSGLAWKATNFDDHVAYAGAAVSFGATVYQAISSIRDNRIAQSRKPLAYLAYARRQGLAQKV